jgi:hypothetical protein
MVGGPVLYRKSERFVKTGLCTDSDHITNKKIQWQFG